MVSPGIQALFGFQLIAVFNSRFAEELTEREQRLHHLLFFLFPALPCPLNDGRVA